jgi:hypothetical protein
LALFQDAQGQILEHYQDSCTRVNSVSQWNNSEPVETGYSNQTLGTTVEWWQNVAQ